MSVRKKTSLVLILGLAICIVAGQVFYSDEKQQTLIPKMGLPSGGEFMDLLDETSLYWSSKIDFAALMPPKQVEIETPQSHEPILFVENFDDMDSEAIEIAKEVPALKDGNVIFIEPLTETPEDMLEETEEEADTSEPAEPSDITDRVFTEPELVIERVAAPEPPLPFLYEIEEEVLRVEGVLVPQKTTVISSSRDGKIQDIYVDSGDLFQKGDILLSYDCEDLNAEIDALHAAEKLAKLKVEKGRELFKLDILSNLEHSELEVEEKKAAAQSKALAAQMEACIIRASYDGRVMNRLANPEEYTRTDRVLMEIASREELETEFIVPSKWLRYLNIGAPLTIRIEETGITYDAEIVRIYGEVDPISQSIQMSARLKSYNDPLLPGMSGLVEINAMSVRQSGIRGYLEARRKTANSDADTSKFGSLFLSLKGRSDG